MITRRFRSTPKSLVAYLQAAAFMLLCVMAGSSLAADASKNQLESISSSSLQGGKLIVRANFRDALSAIPAGFSVTNPARIAIDLPNTVNGTGKSTIEIGEGDVRSISVVEVAARTRLVVNLSRNLTYTTALEGKSLLLTIDASPVNPVKEAVQVTKFAESTPSADRKQSLRDVDFRRGNNGEGRIIVDLSSPNTGIDIRQQGKTVIVDFVATSVPPNLVRRLDVSDFGTPIKTVDLLDQGTNARMVVEPKGLWEYSAYQTDTQFILEIKSLKEDPNKLVQGTGYSGEKLSLNFQSVEVRAVLQVIADFTGLNIITSDTVGGSLTLRLKDVPWDQALDIILQAKGLAKRKTGNVVLIAPSDELATKEKLALEASQQIFELEAVRTESFQLAYAKAADVKTLLGDGAQKLLSKRGTATVDARTNTMFVQDTPNRLDEIRRLVAQLDVPVRQVMIEARIVIADDKFSTQLGARFGNQAGFNSNSKNIGVSNSLSGATTIATGGAPSAQTGVNVNLPAAGSSLALSFLNLGNGNLINLELSALEADGRGKVVASPRVVTADAKKANISQGQKIGYQTQSASGGQTVTFIDAVLSLDVTPQITPDDKIIMDLDIKKDVVGGLIAGIPSVDTRSVKTQLLVNNGDTAVIGGIYEQTIRTDVSKVPVLGDIPFIGNLFKTTSKVDNKTELLIFITPRIIKDQLSIH